jgi:hypothetical protein
MNQLFIISTDAWAAATALEVNSICEDLAELSLYSLPYPEVDIGVSADISVCWVDSTGKPANDSKLGLINGKGVPPIGSEYLLIYHGVRLAPDGSALFRSCEIAGPLGRVSATPVGHIALLLARLLISLLATRNIQREVQHNKLARFGIGRSNRRKSFLARYSYVTTISTPQNLEDDVEHKPTGIKKCPHLRRGYIRRHQHYGPKNQFTRSVWVQPTFVNASEEFTRTRQAYNLSIPAKQLEPTDTGPLEPIS